MITSVVAAKPRGLQQTKAFKVIVGQEPWQYGRCSRESLSSGHPSLLLLLCLLFIWIFKLSQRFYHIKVDPKKLLTEFQGLCWEARLFGQRGPQLPKLTQIGPNGPVCLSMPEDVAWASRRELLLCADTEEM